ncbi:MAG: acyltransferase family protein [Alphaproteobacteria bacterium]
MNKKTNNKITYRPEIDGLRAIAVLCVIIYHTDLNFFNFQILSGGFLGVDIFFVISGYLITSILLKEFNKTGKISLNYFYERRIRRILPAFLMVILISFFAAWFILMPLNFINFSNSAIASIIFLSNLFFWRTGQEYDAEDSLNIPLLHTWSLSVEEQFYIIFPLFLIFFLKFKKQILEKIILFLIFFSFFLAVYISNYNPSLSFYFIFTRLWELLLGSYLATTKKKKKFFSKFESTFSIIGIFCIILSIIFLNDEMKHPSFFTIPVVLGTFFVISNSKKNIITDFLSNKILVMIGLISYSLYLYHYPIFAFSRIISFGGNISEKIIIIFLTLLLSFLSFRFVEKKFRDRKTRFSKVLIFVFLNSILLIFLSFLVNQKEGFYQRFNTLNSNRFNFFEYRKNLQEAKSCFDRKENFCFFDNNSQSTIYLIGDSHMDSILFALKEESLKSNFNLMTMTNSGAPYLENFIIYNKDSGKNTDLYELNKMRFRSILKDNAKRKIAVVGARLPLYFDQSYFDNNQRGDESNKKFNLQILSFKDSNKINHNSSITSDYKQSLISLSKIVDDLIIIYPIPEIGWDVGRRYLNNSKKKEFILEKNFLSIDYKVIERRNSSSKKLLDSILPNNIIRIKPEEIFCNSFILNKCAVTDGEKIFYADGDHLSYEGSKILVDTIFKKLKNN